MSNTPISYQRLTPGGFETCLSFFARQPHELCVYSLSSLIVWTNSLFQPYYAVIDDLCLIKVIFRPEHQHRDHIILPISPDKTTPPEKLAEFIRASAVNSCWFVPAQYIEQYGHKHLESWFSISLQEGHSDYIYLTQDLAQLKGNKYSKKRNLINQFVKEYVNTNRVSIETIDQRSISECLDFLEIWCEEKACGMDPDEDLSCEKQAVINALNNIQALNFQALLLRIDQQVCALAIASPLTDTMGVLHFEKAFSAYTGLYQYLDRECARRLFTNLLYINKENDMNLPGLIKAKKSYHPEKIIPSYKLELIR